eukprot:TRINITY_DN3769_c0_g2_i1.p1 TRINITY_DN3769_c0_g2~~TRINITY_DN3769_c0_g2_i1.p1  ORF type:complete len:210 (-),score=47.48 TRINITY_DN3769_c0_g2_i1:316-945(-)
MFGILVAGRLVQTTMTQVDTMRYVFSIDDAQSINHLVVFMLGTVPFPEGFGGSIYFGWPPYTQWQFLGYITNNKPSAVFRLKNKSGQGGGIDVQMDQQAPKVVAQVGISIEPMANIESQSQSQAIVTAQTSAVSTIQIADMLEFSQRLLKNFVNYALSFTTTVTVPSSSSFSGSTQQSVVPTTVVEKWFESFSRKLQNDPFFWKKDSSS